MRAGVGLCPEVIGRDAELHALGAALDAALSGRGGVVYLSGEAGIGKSRLAREVAARAAARAVPVVVGRAVPGGAPTPYRPWAEALMAALRDRSEPPERTGLGPWLPALRAIIPTLAGGEASGDASAAVRGEALLRLLGQLARRDGLVVVLEDLHWADPDSLAVLEYLTDNLAEQRVLLVATARGDAPSAGSALINRLQARRAGRHLVLARLNTDEVAAMVRACLGDSRADPAEAATAASSVALLAEGVPFLVEEVLAAPGMPASFADSVTDRLVAIAPGQRTVLEAAAVLGRRFDWRVLPAVTGSGAEEVAVALECGVAALLLRVDGGVFRFRHALTREAVLAGVLPPRRAAYAAAALAALEAADPHPAGPDREVAAELAEQAGQPARAGALLSGAGRAALERGALATAIDTLGRAVELLPAGPERRQAQTILVEALALAGRVDEAMSIGEALLAAPNPAEGAIATVELHVRLARAAVTGTRWAAAEAHVAAARAGLDEQHGASSRSVAAAVTVLEAELALGRDDVDTARRLAEHVITVAGATAPIRCQGWEVIGRVERIRDLDAARVAFEHALATAEAAGLVTWRLRALHELGTIELLDRAGTTRLAQARRTAVELGAISTVAVLDLQLCAAYESRFVLEKAGEHAHAALEVSDALGLTELRTKALYFLGENAAQRRDRTQMEHYLGRALAAAPHDRELQAGACGGARAMLALLEGDPAAAVDGFARAAALLRSVPHAEPAYYRGVWPLLAASIGDRRAGAALAQAEQAGLRAFLAHRGLLGYAHAVLVGRSGDRDRAARLARAAESALAAFPIWADLGRWCAGEAALVDGWGTPARWLAEARDAFTAHGIDAMAARCQALLEQPHPARWGRFGLTPRESEVLVLVAAGLANKQIATRLGLSPRTVEKHLEALLRKTAARSRAHLVALAGPPPDTRS